MTTTAQILREAAADVRVRGVCRTPSERNDEVCALYAIHLISERHGLATTKSTAEILRKSAGIPESWLLPTWNDSQVSRAVVASEMESAADLAELMEGRGGSA